MLHASLIRRGGLAAIMAVGAIGVLALLSQAEFPPVGWYVACLSMGSAGAALALTRADRLDARSVMAVAILAHGLALWGAPRVEDDYFRFLWDGWRTLTTGSPYGTPPEAFFGDPGVAPALEPVLDGVNNPGVPTIYGPLLEGLFALSVLLFGPEERGLRLLFALANLGVLGLLLRRLPPWRAALYGWSPFLTAELALHAHPDGVMALLLLGGLSAGAARRPGLAGLLFGAAAGAKIVALAAWPALLRLGPKALFGAVATLGLLYLPFYLQTPSVGLDGTAAFAERWRFNAAVFDLLLYLAPDQAARWLSAGLGVALILWTHWRDGRFESLSGHWVFGALLLVAPVINPWYLVWVAPFAAGRREVWPLAAMAALPLSYLTGLHLERDDLLPYQVHPLAKTAEVAIIAAALAFDLWRARRSGLPAGRAYASRTSTAA